jgi:hypothetical protein
MTRELIHQLSDVLSDRRVDLVIRDRCYWQAKVPTFYGGLQMTRQEWQGQVEWLLSVVDITGGVPEELRAVIEAQRAA